MSNLNPQHKSGLHHQRPPKRKHNYKNHVQTMATGELVTPAGRMPSKAAPPPPAGTNLADISIGTGAVAYPSRTLVLPHPAGVRIPAILAGETRWTANPVPCLNPVIADSQQEAL